MILLVGCKQGSPCATDGGFQEEQNQLCCPVSYGHVPRKSQALPYKVGVQLRDKNVRHACRCTVKGGRRLTVEGALLTKCCAVHTGHHSIRHGGPTTIHGQTSHSIRRHPVASPAGQLHGLTFWFVPAYKFSCHHIIFIRMSLY